MTEKDSLLYPKEDSVGVLPLLLRVSGYAAMERGSELIEAIIEPIDLLKAIYIVDLEHVARFWDDWEGFEKLVTNLSLGNGLSRVYINRMSYLIYLEMSLAASPTDKIRLFGSASPEFQEIVTAARALATKREGIASTPTSRDLLFCTFSHNRSFGARCRNQVCTSRN